MLHPVLCPLYNILVIPDHMQKLNGISGHGFPFPETVIKDHIILLDLLLKMIIILLLLQKLCQFNIMSRRKAERIFLCQQT